MRSQMPNPLDPLILFSTRADLINLIRLINRFLDLELSSPSTPQLHPKRPVIDLAIAIVAIPTLVIFALMLETNLRENWAETDETRCVLFLILSI